MDQPSGNLLPLTLTVAAALHAVVIFGVGFGVSRDPAPAAASLDVILVQTKAEEEPDEAKRMAQAAQQASGRTDEAQRPSSPVSSPSPLPTTGMSPFRTEEASASDTENQQSVITTLNPSDFRETSQESPEEELLRELDTLLREDSRQMEIARLTAELASREQQFSQRPRVSFVDSLSAKSAPEAQYVREWVDKVERVGNLNYPDEARRKQLGGSLILHVLLNHNGDIISVEIGSPSGHQVLDDAAMRIIRLAAPFKPFPEELHEATDRLMITRTWLFQAGETRLTE